MRPKTTARPGFSLLELSLVLAIIGVLMAVAAYNLVGTGNRAKIRATEASMNVLKTALGEYQLNASAYPVSLDVLAVGASAYVEQKSLVDAWKEPWAYGVPGIEPGKPYDLVSKGPDKALGTEDDISIWDIE